jgi:hypothetical protein
MIKIKNKEKAIQEKLVIIPNVVTPGGSTGWGLQVDSKSELNSLTIQP